MQWFSNTRYVILAAACAWGCQGTIGAPLPTDLPDPNACREGLSPAPLKRISKRQYQNTLRDLFEPLGLADALEPGLGLAATMPGDNDANLTFSVMDTRVSDQHVTLYFDVASSVAASVTDTSAERVALAGSCAAGGAISPACVEAFARGFGRRVFRRALSAQDLARVQAWPGDATDAQAVLHDLVLGFLLSPELVYHLELPQEGSGGVVTVSDYDVASRLATALWQSIPDDTLLDAAEAGQLGQPEGLRSEVLRMLDDPRAHATFELFLSEWLGIAESVTFSSSDLFLAVDDGVGADEALYADMRQEVSDLIDYFVWDGAGTFEDLLTTNAVITRSARLASLYGVEPWDGSSAFASFPAGERSGILTRAALLVQPGGRTNPIVRGAHFMKRLLCVDLEVPGDLPPDAFEPPAVNDTDSTRERYAAKTSPPECHSCHRLLNPPGFTLESYDALGRYRSTELIYDDDGAFLAAVPVDPSADLQVSPEQAVPVATPAQLMEALVGLPELHDCFARHYFRFVFQREEADADACTVGRVASAAGESPLRTVLEATMLQPAMRQRNLGGSL